MQRLEKTRAFLTEFIIVILFFTISSVVIVNLYVTGNKKSIESMNITSGYLKAEEIAEKIKAYVDFSEEKIIYDYMTKEAGYRYKEGTNEEYYQYFDSEYNVSTYEEAELVGYVTAEEKQTSAGRLVYFTVEFKDNNKSYGNVKFVVYESEKTQ